MKTTIELPDDLVRELKIHAVREGRKFKDVVAEFLRAGLRRPPSPEEPSHRVSLPLVSCAHSAEPEEEVTPNRVAELLDEDAPDS